MNAVQPPSVMTLLSSWFKNAGNPSPSITITELSFKKDSYDGLNTSFVIIYFSCGDGKYYVKLYLNEQITRKGVVTKPYLLVFEDIQKTVHYSACECTVKKSL